MNQFAALSSANEARSPQRQTTQPRKGNAKHHQQHVRITVWGCVIVQLLGVNFSVPFVAGEMGTTGNEEFACVSTLAV